MATKPKTTGAPVLVTTANRGIFFGYVEDRTTAPTTLTLVRARCCVQFVDTKGFVGLAANGPGEKCRIGPAADKLELFNITSIADVGPKAVEAWEAAPWRR